MEEKSNRGESLSKVLFWLPLGGARQNSLLNSDIWHFFGKKLMYYINSITRDLKTGSKFCSFLLLLSCLILTACESDKHISKESFNGYPRFKVYKTENIWNLLLLDTQTGRLWQAQYSTDNDKERLVTPISTEVLANGQNGRFNLTQTENMWTFILSDSEDGRLWQCQFSTNMEERFCIPIDLNTKEL